MERPPALARSTAEKDTNVASLPRGDSAAEMRNSRISSHIQTALARLLPHRGVFEIRALHVVERGREQWPFTLIGYFDDFRRAAAAVIRELPIREAAGWYFTLNPCDPAVHGRAYNRLRVAGKNDGVKDREIFRRGWLPLDFDPVRPTGVSSTDAEHEEALALAIVVRSKLAARGWPNPVAADSGNGAHLLYPLDLPNDESATENVRRTLEGLGQEFDTATVRLDRNVFNAARIWKLPGTLARKGDDTPDRPHRWARLLDEGEE